MERIFYEIFVSRDYFKDSAINLNYIEEIFNLILKPNNYNELKGFIIGKNIDFCQDLRLLQGGL